MRSCEGVLDGLVLLVDHRGKEANEVLHDVGVQRSLVHALREWVDLWSIAAQQGLPLLLLGLAELQPNLRHVAPLLSHCMVRTRSMVSNWILVLSIST